MLGAPASLSRSTIATSFVFSIAHYRHLLMTIRYKLSIRSIRKNFNRCSRAGLSVFVCLFSIFSCVAVHTHNKGDTCSGCLFIKVLFHPLLLVADSRGPPFTDLLPRTCNKTGLTDPTVLTKYRGPRSLPWS